MTGTIREAPRVLPHNLDAERAILGAVLLENEALNAAAEVIRPTDFFRDAHRRIFSHMMTLSLASSPIDFVSLNESLTRKGELDAIGGPVYISALVDGLPRSTNIDHYARIVKEKARLRSLIVAAQKMQAEAYEAEEDVDTILEEAGRIIFEIQQGGVSEGFVSVGSLLPGVMEKLETIYRTKQGLTGIPTGFRDLDDMTRGLQPGNLILIAARPSQGKTALAINIAQHVSSVADRYVGVFSLEMSSEELMIRQLAATARIDSHRLQTGFLGERDFGRLSIAMGEIGSSKLYIDQSPHLGVFEMRARARRLKAEHGLDLLIVDYIQLAASGDERRAENRTLELGAMSRALKVLARELAIPVVVLSQLSRAPELRSDHRPILSDLRESGALEQDSDVVVFIYRDEYYHPDKAESQGQAELIVAKQRNGPTGTVKLAFRREYTRFENLTTEPEDARLPMGDR